MVRKKELQFDEVVSDVFSDASLEYVERPISHKAFAFVALVGIIVGVLMIGRIAFLNVVKGDFYQARAGFNVNKEKVIPARRGLITDRNGEVLATNTDSFSVFLNASELLKNRLEFNRVIEELNQVLSLEGGEIIEAVEKANYEYEVSIPVVRNISSQQAIAVRDLDLATVTVENDSRREYISGPIFSSVIGYTGASEVGTDIVGKTGLERVYNKEISGENGSYVFFRDVGGNIFDERMIRESTIGGQLTTTIDADLQRFFYERLRVGLRDLGLKAGVGIALDTRNGEVLSLISFPTFDNNAFVQAERSNERGEYILDSSKPLFNRAISGAYSPGSTIKPLVSLAGLHEGVVDETTSVFSAGYIEIPNPFFPEFPSRFVDWKPHGWVNVRTALARSSNIYFYSVGGGFDHVEGLGIERLNHYWQRFGFGQPTGIDLGFESVGFLPEPEEKEERTGEPWRIGDTYNVSIGQGDLLVSPIQLVNFIASIANNGVMYEPIVLKELTSYDGKILKTNKPEKLVDYSTWTREIKVVQEGMEEAVSQDYGTARLLRTLPLTSAGKTGSAQTANNTKTNAFFVGYGPYESPEIAILVLVEDAKEGSLNAVPIAKDVLGWYYQNRVLGQ